jgi:hypothetical protein
VLGASFGRDDLVHACPIDNFRLTCTMQSRTMEVHIWISGIAIIERTAKETEPGPIVIRIDRAFIAC